MFLVGCDSLNDDVLEDDLGVVTDDDVTEDDLDVVIEEDGDFDEFFNLASSSLEYQVVYDYSFDNQQMVMSQFVLGDKMRTDVNIGGMDTRSYVLNGDVISCMYQADSWFCFDSESNDDFDDEVVVEDPLIDDFESFTGSVRKISSRNIAGVQANCFEVEYDDFVYVYCYSNEGVPLLVEGDDGVNYWSMVAREFSLSVEGDAFDLPAEVSSPEDMFGAFGNFDY